jgi:Protein kinase domain
MPNRVDGVSVFPKPNQKIIEKLVPPLYMITVGTVLYVPTKIHDAAAEEGIMVIRKHRNNKHRPRFNISLCLSTGVCVLLSTVTLFQMYMSVHHLDEQVLGVVVVVSKDLPRSSSLSGNHGAVNDLYRGDYGTTTASSTTPIRSRNALLPFDRPDDHPADLDEPGRPISRPTTTAAATATATTAAATAADVHRQQQQQAAAPPSILRHDVDEGILLSKRLETKKNDADGAGNYYSPSTSTSKNNHIASPPNPRVVYLDDWWSNQNDLQRATAAVVVEPLSNRTKPPPRDDSAVLPFERPYYRECHSIADTLTIRPTCNLLHELHATSLSLISTKGSWRSVWGLSLDQDNNNTTTATTTATKTAATAVGLIVKRLRLDREWNHEAYERHDTDALVMEQLSSSRHICDLYASCGPSVVTERATGSARYFLKNPHVTALRRLELGRDLAAGLAQVHAAHFIHNDLNMANILEVDGQLKLNDFNIGLRMRQYKNSSSNNGTVCPIPVRFEAPLWKSPEEIRNSSYVDGYATDVYGLGNLLFQVLTKRQPWTHLEKNHSH